MSGIVIDEGTSSKTSSVHNPQENASVPETKRPNVRQCHIPANFHELY